MMIDISQPALQKTIAEIIGVTRQTVGEIEFRGICDRDMALDVWLRTYCGHMREIAAGRAAAGDLDLVGERALLAREQRERIAMQNKVTRRELAPVILLEQVLAAAGSKVAGILDGIPGMIHRRSPEVSSAVLDLIATEIARARNIAAAVSLDDLRDDPTTPTQAPGPDGDDNIEEIQL